MEITSDFHLTFSEIGLIDYEGFPVAESYAGVAANLVPIPGAVWLLGSGLVGLVGLKRRKKA